MPVNYLRRRNRFMEPDNELRRRISRLETRIAILENELRELRASVGRPVGIGDPGGAASGDSSAGRGDAGVSDPTSTGATSSGSQMPASSDTTGPHGQLAQRASERRPPVPPVMGPGLSQEPTPLKREGQDQRSTTVDSIRSAIQSEDIVSRVGIALLLIGLALMFKFGVDKGWIIPSVRIVIGLTLGIGLSVGGLRMRSSRRAFSRVLLGGGMATFYVTIFAAYQLYSLLPYEIAFVSMVFITALSFALAVRQDDVVLALIATAGGLGTPFLLFFGAPGILWLILFTCLVCSGAIGVYMYRGWRWLLLTAAVGGWAVLTHVWLMIRDIGYLPVADKVMYQAGVLFCLFLFGVVPIMREIIAARDPSRWPSPVATLRLGVFADRPGLWLAVMSPLIALILSREIWDMAPIVWGALEMVVATCYWAVYLIRRSSESDPAISGFGLAAGLILAISCFDLFTSPSLTLLALAAEAGAILVATRTNDDRPVRTLGHLLFAVVAVWTAGRLADVPATPSPFQWKSLIHLTVIGAIAASASLIRSDGIKSAHRVVAMLLLALTWSSLFAGGSTRLIALAIQAAVVVLWVQRVDDRWLRLTGHFLFVVLAFALLQRVTEMSATLPPLVNGASLADLFVIGIVAATSFIVENHQVRKAYRFGAYVAYLSWFWRDLAPLEDGHAFVSIAWGLSALVLIAFGWRLNRDLLRQSGLVTLGVVVLKLFLIDLAEIDPMWRIILFVGFGGLLLLIGYLFPRIWKGDEPIADGGPNGPP